MREERNLEPHVFSLLLLSDLSQIRNGHCCKTPQSKIRAEFLTLLPVNNRNKAIRRILQHFVAKAPNHHI
jgi:hypothetical protein